jgi:hypothetical protein
VEWVLPPSYDDLGDCLFLFYPHYINYTIYIYIVVTMVYKPTNTTGGPHIVGLLGDVG